jgi:hypothetical protein
VFHPAEEPDAFPNNLRFTPDKFLSESIYLPPERLFTNGTVETFTIAGGEVTVGLVARTPVRASVRDSRCFVRQVAAFSYLAPHSSPRVSRADPAAARVSACQISRRSAFRAGCEGFENLLRTLAVLWTRQR